MIVSKAINSFSCLGGEIRAYLSCPKAYTEWEKTLAQAQQKNTWFTKENVLCALQNIARWLTKEALQEWLNKYTALSKQKKSLTIGVVMAGNIPMVGFHDTLCVLLTGNVLCAKLSHADNVLMQFIVKKLIEIEPEWKQQILFTDRLSTSLGAVIATGSNNSAEYFEYYFKNVPRIIRKNRNGIAVLDGKETDHELSALGEDIFTYFGLGCRNVSKLYVPEGYDFSNFFKNIQKFGNVINLHSYANNYNYNRTVCLMDGKKFTDNNFVMLLENKAIPSPVAMVHYEYYTDIQHLAKSLRAEFEHIQCIAASDSIKRELQKHLPTPLIRMGQTQSPDLADYADGIDVVKFLVNLYCL